MQKSCIIVTDMFFYDHIMQNEGIFVKFYLRCLSALVVILFLHPTFSQSALAAESLSGDEPAISVSVTFSDLSSRQKILPELTLSCAADATPVQVLDRLVQYAYLSDYAVEQGILTEICIQEDTRTILYGSDGEWTLNINGEPALLEQPLLDGDSLKWEYLSDQTISPEELEPSRNVSLSSAPEAFWEDSYGSFLGSALSWLKEFHTSSLAFCCFGAAGVSVEYRDIQKMTSAAASTDYISAYQLAKDILAVTFCGIHASNVKGVDLISKLSDFPNIANGGSLSAMMALTAADSNDYPLPVDGINTRQTLQHNILAAQNADGGFSSAKEEESTAFHTALAVTALSLYQGDDTIRLAIQNALRYLSDVQNYDGSFPGTDEFPDSLSTAAVIVALYSAGSQVDSADFTKGHNPVEALLTFQNQSGGFSPMIGEAADENATIAAILALTAAKSGRNICILRTPITLSAAAVSSVPDSSVSEQEEESSAPQEKAVSGFPGTYLIPLVAVTAICLILLIFSLYLWQKNSNKKPPK